MESSSKGSGNFEFHHPDTTRNLKHCGNTIFETIFSTKSSVRFAPQLSIFSLNSGLPTLIPWSSSSSVLITALRTRRGVAFFPLTWDEAQRELGLNKVSTACAPPIWWRSTGNWGPFYSIAFDHLSGPFSKAHNYTQSINSANSHYATTTFHTLVTDSSRSPPKVTKKSAASFRTPSMASAPFSVAQLLWAGPKLSRRNKYNVRPPRPSTSPYSPAFIAEWWMFLLSPAGVV